MKRILSFFLLLLLGPFSQVNASLLPANEAFSLNAQLTDNNVEINWTVSSGYFVVKESIEISVAEPDQMGSAVFPPAIPTVDAFLGNINIYRDDQTIVLPLLTDTTSDLALTIIFEGCADLGICYPPITKNIVLSAPTNSQTQDPLNPITPNSGISVEIPAVSLEAGGPLPVDQAFNLDVVAIDAQTLNVRWLIHKDYYLYKDKIAINIEGANIAHIARPDAILKNDEFFGQVSIYDQPIEISVSLEDVSSGEVTLGVEYQGCWKGGVCYPPQQEYYSINLLGDSNTDISEETSSAKSPEEGGATLPAAFEQINKEELTAKELFQKGGLALVIGAFLAGLALSYTPCVYPMVPILSGIIIGQKNSPSTLKAILMSLVFVLSMSFAYGLIGATAGYFGAGVNIQAVLQNPWVLVFFGLIFIVLAFSMFGYYDVQLPKRLQSKITHISNKQNGGSYIGVAIMGFLSALIVGPCVTPFLATALSYVIADGSATKGAIALFTMGVGMGVPLIVICGWGINALPKSGPWMDTVKHVFGVLMLAVTLYLLDRIISPLVSIALWASLFTIAPIALGAISPLDKSSTPWHRIFKAVSLIVLGYGVLLWLLVARGGGDMYQPLANWDYSANNDTQQSTVFAPVDSSNHLDQLLISAQNNNQIAILKFYADWCVSCKKLERTVFADRSVINTMSKSLALTADVTDNTESTQALLARFDIAGPPAILFFKNTKEIRSQRIIGEINAQDFLKRLNNI
jgi:thiol:disulfide interchange protein DsbD